MDKKLIFEGYLFNHGLGELHRGGSADWHVRVVSVPLHIHGDLYAWELAVERRGVDDALGQRTWLPVVGDDRFKILSQVSLLVSSQKIDKLEWRLLGLEEQLAVRATTVTVPGDAVGEPPKT